MLIPGNHDSSFVDPAFQRLITEGQLLIKEGTIMEGLKMWGSPGTPNDWGAFGPLYNCRAAEPFAKIPRHLDILITHGPPRGILDQSASGGLHHGCDQLLTAVRRIKPRVHVFGHLHQQYGLLCSEDTLFVNAALAGPDYTLANQPIEIEMHLHGAQWFPTQFSAGTKR